MHSESSSGESADQSLLVRDEPSRTAPHELAPGCFGGPLTYKAAAVECMNCRHAVACEPLAQQRGAILDEQMGRNLHKQRKATKAAAVAPAPEAPASDGYTEEEINAAVVEIEAEEAAKRQKQAAPVLDMIAKRKAARMSPAERNREADRKSALAREGRVTDCGEDRARERRKKEAYRANLKARALAARKDVLAKLDVAGLKARARDDGLALRKWVSTSPGGRKQRLYGHTVQVEAVRARFVLLAARAELHREPSPAEFRQRLNEWRVSSTPYNDHQAKRRLAKLKGLEEPGGPWHKAA